MKFTPGQIKSFKKGLTMKHDENDKKDPYQIFIKAAKEMNLGQRVRDAMKLKNGEELE